MRAARLIPNERSRRMDKTKPICSICHGLLDSKWGNNAEPVNDGRCCDKCDTQFVIPIRILQAFAQRKKEG